MKFEFKIKVVSMRKFCLWREFRNYLTISHQFVGKNKDFLQRLVPPCLLFLPVNVSTIILASYLLQPV